MRAQSGPRTPQFLPDITRIRSNSRWRDWRLWMRQPKSRWGAAVARNSAFAFRVVMPAGTLRWNAYIFTSSRFQANFPPLAVNVSPVKLSIGPVGPCSPGIHSGYTRVIGPDSTGIESSARSIFRGASLRSNTMDVVRRGWATAEVVARVMIHTQANTNVMRNSHHRHDRVEHLHFKRHS